MEKRWLPGIAPVAVVMITLNEGHNMRAVLENLNGWAQEVFIVDSYSRDDTVDIALEYGAYVVQRRFRGFGDQWNFALQTLPIKAPWTMKLDPDERITKASKKNLLEAFEQNDADGFSVVRRLWFMGRRMPVKQKLVRVWRTGTCRFLDRLVNEHPIVQGKIRHINGELEHHDSPDLEHWLEKQNRYTTAEALIRYKGEKLAVEPRLFGSKLERRMWFKKNFWRIPFKYVGLFCYHYFIQGAFLAGWPGYAWARLRVDLMRLIDYKFREMKITGRLPASRFYGPGQPDPRVPQYE
jgi:glycosyltransferase involved in cell wall biosynthesis